MSERPFAAILRAMRRGLFLWLTLWSVAFGVCEGAVVVYLRRLFYPGLPAAGPLFPLPEIDTPLLRTEMARELGTLVMLLGVAMLAERRPLRRFAAFAFCFGMWDIVYYAMLHVAIGWPQSLMTWDVLFLLPAPWASPVLAPVLVSLALVGASALVLAAPDDAPSPLRPRDWLVQIACAALMLWAFLWNAGPANRMEPLGHFPWWLFLPALGVGVGCFACRWLARR